MLCTFAITPIEQLRLSTMDEPPVKPLTAFQQFQVDFGHLIPTYTSAGERQRQLQKLWVDADERTRKEYEDSAKTAGKLYRHRAALYFLEHPEQFQQKCTEKQRRRSTEDPTRELLFALLLQLLEKRVEQVSESAIQMLFHQVQNRKITDEERNALKKWAGELTASQEPRVRAARGRFQGLK